MLEGIFEILYSQLLCCWQGYLPLGKVTQSLVQTGLEHFQGWGKDGDLQDIDLDTTSDLQRFTANVEMCMSHAVLGLSHGWF